MYERTDGVTNLLKYCSCDGLGNSWTFGPCISHQLPPPAAVKDGSFAAVYAFAMHRRSNSLDQACTCFCDDNPLPEAEQRQPVWRLRHASALP